MSGECVSYLLIASYPTLLMVMNALSRKDGAKQWSCCVISNVNRIEVIIVAVS